MDLRGWLGLCVMAAWLGAGCSGLRLHRGACLVEISRLRGFQVPECVLPDVVSGDVYVSNIEAAPDAYWVDDGRGYITRLERGGGRAERWLDSTAAVPIHSPKGMCLLQGRLYFTDNSRLLDCDAATGGDVRVLAAGFGKANDLATDGVSVWLSDTKEGLVWCIAPDGVSRRPIPAPEGVNGLAFHGGRLLAVSWDLHDLYELDPKGEVPPRAFGLADHFVNLDGIEVLEDGTFLVSDFVGNKVCRVSADGTKVTLLVEVCSPADIGLDRARGLLYVPLFLRDEVVVFRLK
ncbi:MAG: hypothetical protein JXR77_09145 [Lentisphaeria bacterium]|nr:hypothetical protein [Lentisphaeria bacterium]